jgi:hypothetical protein
MYGWQIMYKKWIIALIRVYYRHKVSVLAPECNLPLKCWIFCGIKWGIRNTILNPGKIFEANLTTVTVIRSVVYLVYNHIISYTRNCIHIWSKISLFIPSNIVQGFFLKFVKIAACFCKFRVWLTLRPRIWRRRFTETSGYFWTIRYYNVFFFVLARSHWEQLIYYLFLIFWYSANILCKL